jgi:hypothetical protein
MFKALMFKALMSKMSTPKSESEKEIKPWIPSRIAWVRWIIIHRRRRRYCRWHNLKIMPAIRAAIFTNTIDSVCCIAVWTLYYYSCRICLGRNFFRDKSSPKA